jgi:hypothetical protein
MPLGRSLCQGTNILSEISRPMRIVGGKEQMADLTRLEQEMMEWRRDLHANPAAQKPIKSMFNGADRGTRTPTVSRQNLNLVRLPISPYPQMEA